MPMSFWRFRNAVSASKETDDSVTLRPKQGPGHGPTFREGTSVAWKPVLFGLVFIVAFGIVHQTRRGYFNQQIQRDPRRSPGKSSEPTPSNLNSTTKPRPNPPRQQDGSKGVRSTDSAPKLLTIPLGNKSAAPGPGARKVSIILNTLVPTLTMASFFYADVMSRFGSGRLQYEDLLEFDVRLDRADDFKPIPNNSLCVIALRYHQKSSVVRARDAVYPGCHLFVMGDEFCREPDARDPMMTFRQFESKSFTDPPMSLPLGPRNDFWNVAWKDKARPLLPTRSSSRSSLFNAVFSKQTSTSREKLADVMASNAFNSVRDLGIIHIADSWTFEPTEESGHFTIEQYVEAVYNSTFTISPIGHNPECFRIYEAIEAGSIPIIAIDNAYSNHTCVGSLDSMRESNTPILFIDSWEELPAMLQKYASNPEESDRLQVRLQEWYVGYMSARVRSFEDRLLQPPPKADAPRILPVPASQHDPKSGPSARNEEKSDEAKSR